MQVLANGQVLGQATPAYSQLFNSAQGMTIGGVAGTATNNFPGVISDVRVWSGFAAASAKAQWVGGNFALEDNSTGNYKINEGDGTAIINYGSDGATGTLTSSNVPNFWQPGTPPVPSEYWASFDNGGHITTLGILAQRTGSIELSFFITSEVIAPQFMTGAQDATSGRGYLGLRNGFLMGGIGETEMATITGTTPIPLNVWNTAKLEWDQDAAFWGVLSLNGNVEWEGTYFGFPAQGQTVYIGTNDIGGSPSVDAFTGNLRDVTYTDTGSVIASYPLKGDAADTSGNNLDGTVVGDVIFYQG